MILRYILIVFFCFHTLKQVNAELIVLGDDMEFQSNVLLELGQMREGQRGKVCQSLVEKLDISLSTTTIAPLTADDTTWHPNDPKGRRSHVVALDTKMRGANRNKPTGAEIYLQPQRVQPLNALYRTGSFVGLLAEAGDLNEGNYYGNPALRERRTVFYKNAWLDSLGFNIHNTTGKTSTLDYKKAKELGWLTDKYKPYFPILEFTADPAKESSDNSP